MKIVSHISAWLCALVLLVSACTNEPGSTQQGGTNQETPPPAETTQPKVAIPDFNADTAYMFVQKQVDFGPRVPNFPAHRACGDFLANTLRQYADSVIEQTGQVKAFDGTMLNMRNIIAEFNPENPRRVLLCAHWDTRPFADQDTVDREKPIDGANDGGSGVGILLEVARQMSIERPGVGVDIVLFDTEDYGQPEDSEYPPMRDSYCLGSQYWGNQPHRKNYSAIYGILLDMVGAKNAKFTWEEVSVGFAEPVLRKVWSAGNALGYGNHFLYGTRPGLIDDHAYINRLLAIPTIDIIEYDANSSSGFYKHWHTHQDNMDGIDRKTLKAVGQTLLKVVYEEKPNHP